MLEKAARESRGGHPGRRQDRIEIEAAQRRGTFVEVAPGEPLGDPPMDAPDGQTHQGDGAKAGVGISGVGIDRRGAEQLVERGRAQVDQPDEQHPKAGRRDNIDVEAALDHFTGTPMPKGPR